MTPTDTTQGHSFWSVRRLFRQLVFIWLAVLFLDYLGDYFQLGFEIGARASREKFEYLATAATDARARYDAAFHELSDAEVKKRRLAGSDPVTVADAAANAEKARKAADKAHDDAAQAVRFMDESKEASAKAEKRLGLFPHASFIYTAGIFAIGLTSYFGGLSISRFRVPTHKFEDGDVRFALTCTFVTVFFALLSYYSFTPSDQKLSEFARTVIESFLNMALVVVGFYFLATSAVDIAKLREEGRSARRPSGEASSAAAKEGGVPG